MRWLITGATGMVGSDLVRALAERDEEAIALGKSDLDILDRDAVLRRVDATTPDVIVNCAAFTKVDDCEAQRDTANAVNGSAVGHLAAASSAVGALLVQLSTDFVFDGRSVEPYQTDHVTAPLSAYGDSKLRGENEARGADRHVILRTSWLFGEHGWNFVEAIRRQVLSGKRELRVVDDQRGRPTFTPNLAEAIIRISEHAVMETNARGIYHYADREECSWFDFASEIVAEMRRRSDLPVVTMTPVNSDEYPRPARRPAYSVLATDRYEEVSGVSPQLWREGLTRYFDSAPLPFVPSVR